jgi:predicted Na+-dependent transporter
MSPASRPWPSADVAQHPARLRSLIGAYPELICVVVAAVVGLTVQSPLAWLASHEGINVLLAVLVFATALTIEPASLRRLGGSWRPLLAAIATGIVVLPALSWAASRLVSAGSLRDGVMAAGLAPCEIASGFATQVAGRPGCARQNYGVAVWVTSASKAWTRRSISSTMGRTCSIGLPAGSSRSQSR